MKEALKTWKETVQQRAEKKKTARLKRLDKAGITYSTEDGLEFIVEGKLKYTPSTGKFFNMSTKQVGSGERALVTAAKQLRA